MSASKIAYRYARAFYEEARDKGMVPRILEDMELIGNTLKQDIRLSRLLFDPSSPSDQKFQILREVFSKYVHEQTVLFIGFIASKKRIYLLQDLSEQIKAIHRRLEGVISLQVTISSGLGEDFGKKIVDKLIQNTGYKFEPEIKVDASLQGGFMYTYGGTVYNYSIKGQLDALTKQFNT